MKFMLRLSMSLLLAASCFVVSGCSDGDAATDKKAATQKTDTSSSDAKSDAGSSETKSGGGSDKH